jgi:hypothetical protein
LYRHGWRKIVPRKSYPKRDGEADEYIVMFMDQAGWHRAKKFGMNSEKNFLATDCSNLSIP